MSKRRRVAPFWLMGLSNTTFGLVGGFVVLPLPQFLAAEGVSEARIAAVSGACLLPGFWVFLLGPLLDVRFSRRWYATLFAVLAGAGLAFAIFMRAHVLVLETALMLAYAAAALSSNALGGWLACLVPTNDTAGVGAKLSAWTQVGTFLGNGLMAGLAGESLRRLPIAVTAVALGALVVLPAAIFLWMPVPEQEIAEARRLAANFGVFFREIWALLRSRSVLVMLLLFVLPTGSFALTNLLGGVAADFHATESFVSRMGGVGLSVAGAAASLLLPVLAKKIRALPLYLLIGTVGSLFTLLLLALPRTPGTFALAFLGENVFQAMSFTAAVAICFTAIGRENPLAATQFGLLTSATVLPIVYMSMLDGRVSTAHGVSGIYWVDGGLSLLACAIMFVVMRRLPWMTDRT